MASPRLLFVSLLLCMATYVYGFRGVPRRLQGQVCGGSDCSPSLRLRLRPIPVDISSSDLPYLPQSIDPSAATLLEPVTKVVELEGGTNLGVLLWAFVLYQGIFTTAGRPADWVLPVVAKGLNCESEQWYIDYRENFPYTVPPAVELVRVLFFLSLGYYADGLVINSFGSDPYWGWATAGSLSIPIGLLALARGADKKATREEVALSEAMQRDFSDFGGSRITRHNPNEPLIGPSGRKKIFEAAESSIILAFRRSYERYRDDTVVSDKQIRRVVRAWVGYKPTPEGAYKHLELQNLRKESKEALAQNLKRAAELRRDASVIGTPDGAGGDDGQNFDNEFVRKVER